LKITVGRIGGSGAVMACGRTAAGCGTGGPVPCGHAFMPGGNPFIDLMRAAVAGTVALPHALNAALRAAGEVLDALSSRLSLQSRGVGVHFALAVALTSVLPVLSWCYIKVWSPPLHARVLVWACAAFCALLGYAMLLQYPRALLQIRDYLAQIVRDPRMPVQFSLPMEDSDLIRTRDHLQRVLEELREKIATIERQKEEMARTEREKAIVESLATTCHYLGQPATVITAYLDLLEEQDIQPASARTMISECQKAVSLMNETLHKLNTLSDYTSEEYLKNQSDDERNRILSLCHD